MSKIAAVTGASGTIGKLVVKSLLDIGWHVRVLTRTNNFINSSKVTVVSSDINDEHGLRILLKGVNAIFHCAAELKDEKIMYSTNVEGTRNLVKLLASTNVSYFCYLSSAGVIGPTSIPFVTETTPCNPNNLYEKTKYEAEMLVSRAKLDMNICILRPTNVVSHSKPGVLLLPINNSWSDIIKVYIKGNEKAHIVYAKDVANAALYFMKIKKTGVNIYLVSCDDDQHNSILNIYNMYQYICNKKTNIKFSLPIFIPNLLRRIFKGESLHGLVQFSSNKLKQQGFIFEFNVERCLREIINLRV